MKWLYKAGAILWLRLVRVVRPLERTENAEFWRDWFEPVMMF